MVSPCLRLGAAVLLLQGCVTPFGYRFEQLGPPGDADLEAHVEVDATRARAVTLQVANKTDLPLQVGWADITLVGPDGRTTALRPDVDLGWVEPGATLTGQLGPFTLPTEGDAALAYQGRQFELQVPVVVRREPRVLHTVLLVHVVDRAKEPR